MINTRAPDGANNEIVLELWEMPCLVALDPWMVAMLFSFSVFFYPSNNASNMCLAVGF